MKLSKSVYVQTPTNSKNEIFNHISQQMYKHPDEVGKFLDFSYENSLTSTVDNIEIIQPSPKLINPRTIINQVELELKNTKANEKYLFLWNLDDIIPRFYNEFKHIPNVETSENIEWLTRSNQNIKRVVFGTNDLPDDYQIAAHRSVDKIEYWGFAPRILNESLPDISYEHHNHETIESKSNSILKTILKKLVHPLGESSALFNK